MGSRKTLFLYFAAIEVIFPIFAAPSTIIDQKQLGETNIQLEMKDFSIVALMSDDLLSLGDYDYNYDYSDLTVKPGVGTGKPPLNASTTAKPLSVNSTISLISPMVNVTENSKLNATGNEDGSLQLGPDKIYVKVEKPVTNVAILPSSEENTESNNVIFNKHKFGTIVPSSRCTSGFIKDKKGRCRRIRRPQRQNKPFGLSRFAANFASKLRKTVGGQ